MWTPHGLYELLLREPGVCLVDVSALVRLDAAKLAEAAHVTVACEECAPGAHPRRPGAPKPFCMNYGRDLVPGWERPDAQQHGTAHCAGGRP